MTSFTVGTPRCSKVYGVPGGMKCGLVWAYIRTCAVCQRDKPSNKSPAGWLTPLPNPKLRWDMVSLDLIVQLPVTKMGYNAICVLVVTLSKMVHLAPTTKSATIEDIAQTFLQRVVCLHGLPDQILSDRNPRFTGRFWGDLCRRLGTTRSLSSEFHLHTDGQSERVNRALGEMLRHYVNPVQSDWDSF
jgi:hypothetical protein